MPANPKCSLKGPEESYYLILTVYYRSDLTDFRFDFDKLRNERSEEQRRAEDRGEEGNGNGR